MLKYALRQVQFFKYCAIPLRVDIEYAGRRIQHCIFSTTFAGKLPNMKALLESPYFILFVIISLGILFGRIKYRGISLDMSAVIFVALLFGHWGYQVPAVFQTIGLLLFIYSVGIQAGPGLFESFRRQGLNIIIISLTIIVSGALLSLLAGSLLHIERPLAVGLFAGALTSTPGLAAAIEASSKPEMASIGYGVAYPFGVIGVILFIIVVTRILRINIKTEEEAYKASLLELHPEIGYGHYVVENKNMDQQTIEELQIRSMTGASISRILHGSNTVIPKPKTRLYLGDIIRAVGSKETLEKVRLLVGPQVETEIPLNAPSEVQWILVTNKDVVNKTLNQLNLFSNYEATVTRVRRSGIDIAPKPQLQLKFGDKLLVACQGDIHEVATFLGNDDKKLSETDFLPIALGLVLGILVGEIEIPLWSGFSFKLGLTGGVLAIALILSRIGKTGPVLWHISGPANQLIRTLGLLLFLSAVGTQAGSTLVDTMSDQGIKLFLAGLLLTFIPMITALLVGRFFMRLNFLTLLGTITGGMTSTPGLTAINSLTDSEAPSIAYATVYPMALVAMIVASQLLAML